MKNDSKHRGTTFWVIVVAGILVAIVLLFCFAFPYDWTPYKDALTTAAALINISGVLALAVAFLQYAAQRQEKKDADDRELRISEDAAAQEQRIRDIEEAKLAGEFMSQFYAPDLAELRKELRRHLRDKGPFLADMGHCVTDNGPSLEDQKIRVLNFFESLSIAVTNGALAPETVDRMLRMPIIEVMKDGDLSGRIRDVQHFSYEGCWDLIETMDKWAKKKYKDEPRETLYAHRQQGTIAQTPFYLGRL